MFPARCLRAVSGVQLRWQNIWLLAASYLFYGWWDVRFLFLIVISTALDYCCGFWSIKVICD